MGGYCPATFCPLFAINGSPWTGEKNAPCAREQCGFFHDCGNGKLECNGKIIALEQIHEPEPLQIGEVRQKRDKAAPKTYECQRAGECQWQIESGDKLCPPRYALSIGEDPKKVAY